MRLLRRSAPFLAVCAAVIGVLLLLTVRTWVHISTPRPDPPVTIVAASANVIEGPITPPPVFRPTDPPAATPDPRVPSDPGHGPQPVCWFYPGQGLAPGATCPPRPPR